MKEIHDQNILEFNKPLRLFIEYGTTVADAKFDSIVEALIPDNTIATIILLL